MGGVCYPNPRERLAWHFNYLVLVYIRFWALNFDLIVVLLVRSQFFEFLRETLYKHDPGSGWSRKRKVSFFFSSCSKCLSMFDLFEGL